MKKCKVLALRSFRKGGFTLIELLIVIAIIALLMAILIPALNKAKEHGKRAACLSNLKQLTLAWMMYAQANDDKIVNGAPESRWATNCQSCTGINENFGAGEPPLGNPSSPNPRYKELPWVGPGWDPVNWGQGIPATENQQICAMKTGAIWKYLKERNIYHCPTGEKGMLITYETIDSMNGMYEWRGNDAVKYTIKNIGQIKNPASRFVYMDTGRLSPDSYAVFYKASDVGHNNESWFEIPMVRHGNGTNAAFADGHSARWMWKAKETVKAGLERLTYYVPTTNEGKQDLYRMQIGCWGKLGYQPSIQVKLED